MLAYRLPYFSLIAFPLLFAGCGMSANKQAAETTAAKLYQASSQKDWDAILQLYSPEFYQKTNKEQWREMLLGIHEKLGDYKSHQLTNWNYQTYAGVGGTTRTVVLIYQVQYEKGEATETLTFIGHGDDKTLTISGHQIISPALVMPLSSSKSADTGGSKEKRHP